MANDFQKSLELLKHILVTDGKFVAVQRDGAYIFEIRTKEQGHNVPHFHVVAPDFEASYSLIDFKCLAESGKLTSIRNKRIIEFAKCHHEELKSRWKEFHQWNIA